MPPTMRIPAGPDVFIWSRDPDRWYRVIEGWVQLRQVLSDEREVAIMLLGPGDLIVPVPAGRELIAEALVDTTITVINEMVDPVVRREMIAAQFRRITTQHHLVTEILTRDRTVRLLMVLLEIAGAFGIEGDNGMVKIELQLTDEHLAQMTGKHIGQCRCPAAVVRTTGGYPIVTHEDKETAPPGLTLMTLLQ